MTKTMTKTAGKAARAKGRYVSTAKGNKGRYLQNAGGWGGNSDSAPRERSTPDYSQVPF